MKPLEIDLNRIHQLSKQNEDQNTRFRSYLKGIDNDMVDNIVHRLYKEIAAVIDCTECGNCCTIFRTTITDSELDTLAKKDNLSRENFIENFTEQDEPEKTRYLKDIPCKYLSGKKCSIYEIRPEECRYYPHIHKHCFNSRTLGVISNCEICPIVFNVWESLKEEFKFL
ncbi:MAG TPA: YkgJ family cysteine cluster protein [Bacteroidales bacterium]|nr:YkgJ family cysteine cluster protein [Bacteroidales bacterium]